jgi:hypothetical protein
VPGPYGIYLGNRGEYLWLSIYQRLLSICVELEDDGTSEFGGSRRSLTLFRDLLNEFAGSLEDGKKVVFQDEYKK